MDKPSAKMNALFYLLDQLREANHKVLVFSQFTSMLAILALIALFQFGYVDKRVHYR